MEKIPTAEKFLSDNIDRTYHPYVDTDIEDCEPGVVSILDSMIEFAKLHVKAALQAASETARAKEDPNDYGTGEIWVDKQSILTAYPIQNIK